MAQRKKILLVEDDDVSAMLVKGMLKRLPVDFIHVKTFAEAQEQIQEADFDMVMLDLGLPDSYLSQTARDWPTHMPMPRAIAAGTSCRRFQPLRPRARWLPPRSSSPA